MPRDELETARGPDPAPDRVVALDILRGLMALAVVLYHLQVWTRAFEGGLRNAVVVLGIYSVEGFFLISGFCFFHLYARTSLTGAELWSFHVKRWFRIAPLYYLAVALTLACDIPFMPSFTWTRLAENLSLGFGLFHPNHAMVLGGWSIGIEYVFYLALPGLLWLARWPGALHALGLVLVVCAVQVSFGKVQAVEEARRFNVYASIPNHAFLFLFGAMIAELRRRTRFRLPEVALLVAPCTLVFAAVRWQPGFHDHFDVMAGFARVAYVVLCCAAVLTFAFTPVRSAWARPLVVLGELSYSMYLMHPIAWYGLAPSLANMPPLAQAGCGLVATLAIAWLTHHVVERPAIACGRVLAARLRINPDAAAPAARARRRSAPA